MTRFIIPAIALVSVILSAVMAYANYQYAGKLAEARAQVKDRIEAAKAASAASERALIVAAEEAARADSATQSAEAHATRARALKAQLAEVKASQPADTAAMLAQVLDERDIAQLESAAWEAAYEDEKRASASLLAANKILADSLVAERAASVRLQESAGKLVDASQRSFWDRFAPKVAVNATVGIDPLQPEQGVKKVVGVGLSWSL